MLVDEQTLAKLTRRSDAKGLIRLALHVSLAVAAGLACQRLEGSVWFWPVLFGYGVVLVAFFAPLHETIHYTAFGSGWLNVVLSSLCGLLLMIPPRYFRSFHLEHHRYTQNLARDPELGGTEADSRLAYLWRASGIPFWLERGTTTVRHARGEVEECFVPTRCRKAIVREARYVLLAYLGLFIVSVMSGSAVLFWYWVVPVLMAQPVLRLYLMAEHGRCPFVPDMLANSRTTRSNGLVRFLAWNMPYHAEHHAYAAVPFHALPALHQHLAPAIGVRSPGYLAFHRRLWRSFPSKRRT